MSGRVQLLVSVLLLPWCVRGLQIDAPRQHDFGQVYHADELVHTWTLHNETDERVQIQHVSLGCDVCMRFDLSETDIAPGKAATLTVWLDARTLDGQAKKEVVVRLRGDEVRLLLAAVVVQPFRLEPEVLRVHFVRNAHAGQSRAVRVEAKQALKGKLVQLEAALDGVAVEIHEIASGEYEIGVEISAGWPIGISRADLRLLSDHPDDPVCLIPLIVSQAGAAEVIPSTLEFLASDAEKGASRILFVKSDWAECGALQKVTQGNAALPHRIMRGAQSGEYRVFLDFAAGKPLSRDVEVHFQKGRVAHVPVVIKASKP